MGLGIGPTAIGRVIGVVEGLLHARRRRTVSLRAARRNAASGCAAKAASSERSPDGRDVAAGSTRSPARYAVRLNGLTEAAITKLDVLSGFERLSFATRYSVDGASAGFGDASDQRLSVEYDDVPGWSESIEECRSISDLPQAARAYVDRIQRALGVPVALVSVGRERSQLAR